MEDCKLLLSRGEPLRDLVDPAVQCRELRIEIADLALHFGAPVVDVVDSIEEFPAPPVRLIDLALELFLPTLDLVEPIFGTGRRTQELCEWTAREERGRGGFPSVRR